MTQKAMVLSVEPAMAWAIAHLGKRTENRSKRTHYRGLLLIQASKSDTHYKQHRELIENMGYKCPEWDSLPKGVVIAQCYLTGCSPKKIDTDLGWGMAGYYWWHFDGVELVEQFLLKGRPGLPFSVALNEEVKLAENISPKKAEEEFLGNKLDNDLSPRKKRRDKGLGGSHIEERLNKGKYKEYYFHWEFWSKGDRISKRSKYIPKKKLAKVQQLQEEKAPVKEILAVLGVKYKLGDT